MAVTVLKNDSWIEWRPKLIFGCAVATPNTLVLPWLPTDLLRKIRDNHERAHTWGIVSCTDRSCIMYEEGDSVAEKIHSWPYILYRRFRTGEWFCDNCLRTLLLSGGIAYDGTA